MSDYHKQTEFLRQCIRYHDPAKHEELEGQIAELQRSDRCLRRAVWLMALLAALAVCGLCFGALFLAEYPLDFARFHERFFVKVPSALGLGSLACLFGFAGLRVVNRRNLDHRREECRRLTTELMEVRLGQAERLPERERRTDGPEPELGITASTA